jgi:hypothetical protein
MIYEGMVDYTHSPISDHIAVIGRLNIQQNVIFSNNPIFPHPVKLRIQSGNKRKMEQFYDSCKQWYLNLSDEIFLFTTTKTKIPHHLIKPVILAITEISTKIVAKHFTISPWKRPRNEQLGKIIGKINWAGRALRAVTLLHLLHTNSLHFNEDKSNYLMNILSQAPKYKFCIPEITIFESFTLTQEWKFEIIIKRRKWWKKERQLQTEYNKIQRHNYLYSLQKEYEAKSKKFRYLFSPKKHHNITPNIIRNGNIWIHDPEQIKSQCAQYFESLYNQPILLQAPWTQATRLEHLANSNNDKNILDNFSWEVFLNIIHSAHNTSPGLDEIQYIALKILPEYSLILLYNILLTVIKDEIIPEELNSGVIVLIYKGGEKFILDNYRGITLLSCLYKIISSFMRECLSKYIQNKISINHGGAIKGRSAQTKIALLDLLINDAIRSNISLYIFSADVKKAFDTVSQQGLHDALYYHGVDKKFISFHSKITKSNWCKVRTIYGLSEEFPIINGVRQGCGMSPIIFVLFMDLYVSWLNEQDWAYQLNNITDQYGNSIPFIHNSVSSIVFIDDLSFLTNNEDSLISMIRSYTQFLTHYNMSINPTKSYVANWVPLQPNYSLTVDNTTYTSYNSQNNLKILGFIFDPKGILNTHWKLIEEKLINKAKVISMGPRDIRMRVFLFNMDLTAILRYYAPLLNYQNPNITTLQRTCVQIIFGSFHIGRSALDRLSLPINQGGIGITNWSAIIAAASVDMIYQCINSNDLFLRLLTSKTLLYIKITMNITSNDLPYHKDKRNFELNNIPAFILGGLNIMKKFKLSFQLFDSIHLLSWSQLSWQAFTQKFPFHRWKAFDLFMVNNQLKLSDIFKEWNNQSQFILYDNPSSKDIKEFTNHPKYGISNKFLKICNNNNFSTTKVKIHIVSTLTILSKSQQYFREGYDNYLAKQLDSLLSLIPIRWPISHSYYIGTDGSFKEGIGGCGIVDENNNSFKCRFNGHQSILKAELLAILVGLIITSE